MSNLYEVRRSYMVVRVATIVADTEEEAVHIAKTEPIDAPAVYWKEYDGDYFEECDFDCEYQGENEDECNN